MPPLALGPHFDGISLHPTRSLAEHPDLLAAVKELNLYAEKEAVSLAASQIIHVKSISRSLIIVVI